MNTNSIEYQFTGTSRVKLTVTADRTIRLKIPSDMEQTEIDQYTDIAKCVAQSLKIHDKTMRGKMRLSESGQYHITLMNDAKTISESFSGNIGSLYEIT